jgi:hypothetical protein
MKLCPMAEAAVLLLSQGYLATAAIPANKTSWYQYAIAPEDRHLVPVSVLSTPPGQYFQH